MIESLNDCISLIVNRWDSDFLEGVNGKLQYILTTPLFDSVNAIKISFQNNIATVEVGMHDSPDLTYTMTSETLIKMLEGKPHDAGLLAMKGDIKITGVQTRNSRVFMHKLYKASV